MPGDISKFLSHIKDQGIAKTSHFDVAISLNSSFASDAGMPEILKLRCESAELPGRQIATTDNKIYGPIYKVPYQTIFSEMTMIFVDTAKMDIRVFFEDWSNAIFDPNLNQMNYVDDFIGTALVTQYDVIGDVNKLNPTLQFKLINIFPTNINQLSTTWGDDAPHKLSVTFFYERYQMITFPDPLTFSTVESLTAAQSRYQSESAKPVTAESPVTGDEIE